MGIYDQQFFDALDDDRRRSASTVAPLIIDLFSPRSVVDVGCGLGSWLRAFADCGIEDYMGFDGDYVDREALQIPADRFRPVDLAHDLHVDRAFDLCTCLEVAEHLSSVRADGLVADLTRLAPVVVFSAAAPGQGGVGHVNEQWLTYWAEKFMSHDYVPHDVFRPRMWWWEDVSPWYRQNMLAFVSSDAVTPDRLVRWYGNTRGAVAAAHPEMLQAQGLRTVARALPRAAAVDAKRIGKRLLRGR